ncbi:hypothetical protein SNEBB_009153 [Seison nebaliae]|nr:hypothetical protein SNEBB_009153 [Seison nebaliae]
MQNIDESAKEQNLLIRSPSQKYPIFQPSCEIIKIRSGRNVILPCVVESEESTSVTWLRQSDGLVLTVGKEKITPNSKYNILYENQQTKSLKTYPNMRRLEEINESELNFHMKRSRKMNTIREKWNLSIKDIQEDDGGYYICQSDWRIDNNVKDKFSDNECATPRMQKIVKLEVLTPPKFVESKTTADLPNYVNLTEQLIISCAAGGFPSPTIRWYLKGSNSRNVLRNLGNYTIYNGIEIIQMMTNKTDSQLIFRHIRPNVIDNIECRADNGISPSISRRLFFRFDYKPIVWSNPETLYSLVIDNDDHRTVNLECRSSSFPSSKQIVWIKHENHTSYGTSLQITESDRHIINNRKLNAHTLISKLMILDVQPNDSGYYSCTAQNRVGRTKKIFRVFVTKISRKIVESGKPLKKPLFNYQLERNGESLFNHPNDINRIKRKEQMYQQIRERNLQTALYSSRSSSNLPYCLLLFFFLILSQKYLL